MSRSFSPIYTNSGHLEPQTPLSQPSKNTYLYLGYSVPHAHISRSTRAKHFSRLSKPTYIFLGNPASHAPLSIMLIMNAPLSSIRSCTHLSLGRHVHLCWSYGPVHTSICRSVHVHISWSTGHTNNFLDHTSPHTHLSVNIQPYTYTSHNHPALETSFFGHPSSAPVHL
jgi:hypothetical protein